MTIAVVTSRGRVTIPQSVRTALRRQAGERLEFVMQGRNKAVLCRAAKTVDEVFGMLYQPGRPVATIAEMKAAIAHRMHKRGLGPPRHSSRMGIR